MDQAEKQFVTKGAAQGPFKPNERLDPTWSD